MTDKALMSRIKELTTKSQHMRNAVSKGNCSNEYRIEWYAVKAELEDARKLALETSAHPMKPYGCNPFGKTGHMNNHPGD